MLIHGDVSQSAQPALLFYTSCHAHGMNHIALGKSLSKGDLTANKRNSSTAIIALVTNGKSPMHWIMQI